MPTPTVGLTQIEVQASFDRATPASDQKVSVDLSPGPNDGTIVSVQLNSAMPGSPGGYVVLSLPSNDVRRAEAYGCGPGAGRISSLANKIECYFPKWTPPSQEQVGPLQNSTKVRFVLPGEPYMLKRNRVSAAAVLPQIMYSIAMGRRVTRPDRIRNSITMEAISHSSTYTWSGSNPQETSGRVTWISSQLSDAPTPETAVSLSAQNQDQWFLFVAGALVGIAGGAFIGAITEVLRS